MYLGRLYELFTLKLDETICPIVEMQGVEKRGGEIGGKGCEF